MKHLYVHVPFCDTICSYCDFFRVKKNDGLVAKWLLAVRAELQTHDIRYVETIYIGGGTPSALSLSQLEELLILLQPSCHGGVEFSVEANPESLTPQKIACLVKYGVNRISLGVQTLDDCLLHVLERQHTKQQVLAVINNLHDCGIHNISIDMMYGFNTQSMEMWSEHLQEVCQWPISHISIYALTIEDHAAMQRNGTELVDNEAEGCMYEIGVMALERCGFMQYEISNFAKNQQISRHNAGYWKREPYIGIGCGAHGFLQDVRYENTHNFLSYFAGQWREKEETIDFHDSMFETIMLGLRMCEGIALLDFQNTYHCTLEQHFHEAVDKHITLGHLLLTKTHLMPTKKGMQFLHTVLLDFM